MAGAMASQRPISKQKEGHTKVNSWRDSVYNWLSDFDSDCLFLCNGEHSQFVDLMSSGTINDFIRLLKLKTKEADGHRQNNSGVSGGNHKTQKGIRRPKK
jgi:hypothetical protein